MPGRASILRPLAHLAGLHARAQARRFLAAHDRTRTVQEALLGELLAAASGSDFARDHGLDRVRSYADLVRAVPLGDYARHEPYVRRVLAGETTALFAPGTAVRMFAMTSGSTGTPKYIPATERFLSDYQRGWNVFGWLALRDHPSAWLRKIVTIASSAHESRSPTGLPCGAISGALAQRQKWIVRRMYPVPPAVRELSDPTVRMYATLWASIVHDVAFLTTANPSSLIQLARVGDAYAGALVRDVRDGTFTPPGEVPSALAAAMRRRGHRAAARRLEGILRRTGRLLPRDYWNLSFLLHWTGGTVGLYLPAVRELYGDVPIRDIGLLASEGRFSVPVRDGTPGGVADITSAFLEFIPAEQIERPDPQVRRAHELTAGEEYFLVLSNFAGLWRYAIDDRVRVQGFLGQSPIFEFLSRGLHACSMTGEKLTEHQVVAAMAQAGAPDAPERFVLQGHFADPPYYELALEPRQALDALALARRLDTRLRQSNIEYDSKRASGRLGPVRPRLLPAGALAEQEARNVARRRGRSEQYKHQYLLPEVVNDLADARPAAPALDRPARPGTMGP